MSKTFAFIIIFLVFSLVYISFLFKPILCHTFTYWTSLFGPHWGNISRVRLLQYSAKRTEQTSSIKSFLYLIGNWILHVRRFLQIACKVNLVNLFLSRQRMFLAKSLNHHWFKVNSSKSLYHFYRFSMLFIGYPSLAFHCNKLV